MNVFNKIVVVILLLFLVFISAIGIINIYAGFFTWAEIPSLFLSPEVIMSPLIGTLILAAIFVVSVLLLVFEFYRRRAKGAIIASDNRGESMVTTNTVAKEVEQELLRREEIKDTRVKPVIRKDGVFVDIYAKISEGANINLLTEEIRNGTYDFLTQKLGLKVGKINFTITGFIAGKKEMPDVETAVEKHIGDIFSGKEEEAGKNLSEEKPVEETKGRNITENKPEEETQEEEEKQKMVS